MKLGEIKLEALRLMNESNYQNLIVENFNMYLREPRLKKFLYNMDNSINRAIDYLNKFEILKPKSLFLKNYVIEKGNNYAVFDIGNISDILVPKMIFYYTNFGEEYFDFSLNGTEIFVNTINIDNLKLVYVPRLKNIDANCPPDTEVDIPDSVARIIPYYIKYDLYQEEEPALASESLKQFEKMANAFKNNHNEEKSYSLERVFGSEEI